MPNVMAALPNIGAQLLNVAVWLTPTTRVQCSNAANIGQRKDLDAKLILHLTKFCYGARALKSVYIVYQPRRRPNIVQCLVGLR